MDKLFTSGVEGNGQIMDGFVMIIFLILSYLLEFDRCRLK